MRSSPLNPRIYQLPVECVPTERTTATNEADWLAHISEAGFSHVLIRANNFEPLQPLASKNHDSAMAALVQRCRDAGIGLLLEIDIATVATDAPLRAQHPAWFSAVADADTVPDPRQPVAEQGARWRLHDVAVAEAAVAWWAARMAHWASLGVAGFWLTSLPAAQPDWWVTLLRRLREQQANVLVLGCADRLSAQVCDQLGDVGFDYACVSIDDYTRLDEVLSRTLRKCAAMAPPLIALGMAASENMSAVNGAGAADGESLERVHRSMAWLAASAASGWAMHAGFEFGVAPNAIGGSDTPKSLRERGVFDLGDALRRVHAWCLALPMHENAPTLHSGGGWVGVLRRMGNSAHLVLINQRLDRETIVDLADLDEGAACGFSPWRADKDLGDVQTEMPITLAPGETRALHAQRTAPVLARENAADQRQHLSDATGAPRIAIERVTPAIDDGRFPVKRVVGDRVQVEADVFMDGHDALGVVLRWRALDDKRWHEQRMQPVGNDRYRGHFTPSRVGRHEYAVHAWRDAYETWHHEVTVKHDAGIPIALELQEGQLLVEATAADAQPAHQQRLRTLATALSRAADDASRYAHMTHEDARAVMREADLRPFTTEHSVLTVEVDRRAAQFASWYELFPRSVTSDSKRHGTLRDVITRLPAIEAMGFDVLYFPPIHPIGSAFRKGPNNTLTPGPDDPGSPYAIGSAEGGHTAIHSELGTIEDFRTLRDAAQAHGLELALDFAIQCSPDHPWLAEHPDWFDWRPDGSLRYAENPPKKYQDIVNVDFYTAGAVPSLWQALCDVVLFWAGEGVRTFRVDNPHTKPFPFWEWMIARVRESYPDTLFLAEAFTRPKPMYRLAKGGFNQSYTYFTWRHGKQEFIDYLTELTQGPPKDFFRPHFFVNTPDINPVFLQHSGRSGFLIRSALATTLSGLWGMYSGFELCEATPVPGKEEYLDSEKYEIRPRDWNMPGNIIAEITRLNAIRRAHPALQSHLGVRFLPCDNEQVLYFEKFSPSGADRVLVAINLDPHGDQAAAITLPFAEWGLADDATVQVDDLLHDLTHHWHGANQNVWLGQGLPYTILHARLDP